MHDLDSLLDIKAAARFLRVSEASLRRWTNAGSIPCFRIGGRKERRFRLNDLVAFLDGPTEGFARDLVRAPQIEVKRAAATSRERSSATHSCAFYASPMARERQAVRFLAGGLGPDSRDTVCFLVAAPEARRAILAELEARLPSVRADGSTSRLVLSSYAASADAQIEYWEANFERALGSGASALRVVGNVSGAPFAVGADMEVAKQYEEQYERVVSRRFPVTTLCQYDTRPLRGLDVVDLLNHHTAVWAGP